jgi:hypothetical protein
VRSLYIHEDMGQVLFPQFFFLTSLSESQALSYHSAPMMKAIAYKCCLLETGHLCSWNLKPVWGVYQLLNIPAGTGIKYLLEKNTKLAVIELLRSIHTSLVLIWVQGWFLAGMWQVYITWHWYSLWYYIKPLPSRYLSMLVWYIGLDTRIKYQTSLEWPKSGISLRPVLAGSNLR